MRPTPDKFRDRVIAAAEAALKANGSVGPLELFQSMRLLHPIHFDGWRKGNAHYRDLEQWIQVGPEKFEKTLRYFAEWVSTRGLRPIEASYTRRTARGIEPLPVTADGNPEREKFYRNHYAPAELTGPKSTRLAEQLTKPPDLVDAGLSLTANRHQLRHGRFRWTSASTSLTIFTSSAICQSNMPTRMKSAPPLKA